MLSSIGHLVRWRPEGRWRGCAHQGLRRQATRRTAVGARTPTVRAQPAGAPGQTPSKPVPPPPSPLPNTHTHPHTTTTTTHLRGAGHHKLGELLVLPQPVGARALRHHHQQGGQVLGVHQLAGGDQPRQVAHCQAALLLARRRLQRAAQLRKLGDLNLPGESEWRGGG